MMTSRSFLAASSSPAVTGGGSASPQPATQEARKRQEREEAVTKTRFIPVCIIQGSRRGFEGVVTTGSSEAAGTSESDGRWL